MAFKKKIFNKKIINNETIKKLESQGERVQMLVIAVHFPNLRNRKEILVAI